MVRVVVILTMLGFSTSAKAELWNPFKALGCAIAPTTKFCPGRSPETKQNDGSTNLDELNDAMSQIACGVVIANRCDTKSYSVTLAYKNIRSNNRFSREFDILAPGETLRSDINYIIGEFLLKVVDLDTHRAITKENRTIFFGDQERRFQEYDLRCGPNGSPHKLSICKRRR